MDKVRRNSVGGLTRRVDGARARVDLQTDLDCARVSLVQQGASLWETDCRSR